MHESQLGAVSRTRDSSLDRSGTLVVGLGPVDANAEMPIKNKDQNVVGM
jgi:hypothetical protein